MIVDIDTGHVLAHRPVTALGWRKRIFGLMGKRFETLEYDALIFPRCRALHTCFMRMPIDILFLSRDNRATVLLEQVKPWHIAFGRGYWAIELPAGTLQTTGCAPGHRINMNMEIQPEDIPLLTLPQILPEILPSVSTAEKTLEQTK